MLRAFAFDTCKAEANWNMKNFIADQTELVRRQVGIKGAAGAFGRGVDSSVVAALLLRAIVPAHLCAHVNHGSLRKGEPEQVVQVFRHNSSEPVYVTPPDRFDKLAGVADPSKAQDHWRRIHPVFEEEARKLSGIEFFAQGTFTRTLRRAVQNQQGQEPPQCRRPAGGPGLSWWSSVPAKDEARRPELGLFRRIWSTASRSPAGAGGAVPGRHHPRPAGGFAGERRHSARGILSKAGLDKTAWQYFTIVPDLKRA